VFFKEIAGLLNLIQYRNDEVSRTIVEGEMLSPSLYSVSGECNSPLPDFIPFSQKKQGTNKQLAPYQLNNNSTTKLTFKQANFAVLYL